MLKKVLIGDALDKPPYIWHFTHLFVPLTLRV